MNDYLNDLNEQQRAAVEYLDGPQLVIAGAGSGKTRVLTYKIVHLLHNGYAPYRIMALTFTNKAAREMRERIEGLVGADVARQLWMGTFHSIFARLLRVNAERLGYRHDYTIYDTSDSKALVKMIVRDMQLDEKVYTPSAVFDIISDSKNKLISPAAYAADDNLRQRDARAGRPATAAIYQAYADRCRIAGAMDFDDLLMNTNVLLRDNPDVAERYRDMFRYILVDEYQDTNFAQHMIMMQLCGKEGHLCVVGDDAQSIYSFRGANIDNILKLERFYPSLRTFKLERNYRSTQNIIDAANSLITHNEHQIPKHIFSTNERGSLIEVVRCYSDYEEAYIVANHIVQVKSRAGCAYGDFAVLYRTNAQSRVLEQALSNGGRRDSHGNVRDSIPYRIYGGLSFYQRKEIKDAVAYFRLTTNPDDDEALLRVINYPPRGIGDTTVGRLRDAAFRHNVSLWHAVSHARDMALPVNNGTLRKLDEFAALVKRLSDMVATAEDALQAANNVIAATGLMTVLMGDKTPENISRQENLRELINAAADFVSGKQEQGLEGGVALADFLAETSLLTDQDDDKDADSDRVTLMTVHAAKGLEFAHIIIVGAEEDLFPSSMSTDTPNGVEEERRLMYVAITRAKTTCMITFAEQRSVFGQQKQCVMSRFLREIDPRYLQVARRWDNTDESDRVLDRPAPRYPITNRIADRRKPAPRAPYTPPRPAISRPAVATSGPYATHTAAELAEGMMIQHERFGVGVITAVDTSTSDHQITVTFGELGERRLMLKFAKFLIKNQ